MPKISSLAEKLTPLDNDDVILVVTGGVSKKIKVSTFKPALSGVDGASAYQLALDAGFVGSQAVWRASLKGDTGDAGPQGDAGADGALNAVARVGDVMSGNLAVHTGTTTATLGSNNLYITDSLYTNNVAYYGQENSFITSQADDTNNLFDAYSNRLEVSEDNYVTSSQKYTVITPSKISLSTTDGGISAPAMATLQEHVTTKKYVDDAIVSGVAGKVSKTGDTMSGTLSVSVPVAGTSNLGWQGVSVQSTDFTQSADYILDYMSIYLTDPGVSAKSIVINPDSISLVNSDTVLGITYSADIQSGKMSLKSSDGLTTTPTVPTLPEHVTTKKYVDDSVAAVSGGGSSSVSVNLGAGTNADGSLGNIFYKDVAADATITFTNFAADATISVIINNTALTAIQMTFSNVYREAGILYVQPSSSSVFTFMKVNSKVYMASANNLVLVA